MKSDHRHELKTNELGKWALQARQSAEKYSNQILAGMIGLLILGAIALYWTRSSSTAEAAGWTAMGMANSAEDFANVADKYPGTSVGAWARLKEGEHHLTSGMQLAFTDRASGISDLNKARDCFEKLVNDKTVPDDVKERALFGLGRCLEATSDRNTEQAIAVYVRLLNGYPYTVYKSVAESRVATLKTGGAQDFYAWFHEQSPKPRDRELPRDGMPRDGIAPESTDWPLDRPAANGAKQSESPAKSEPAKSAPLKSKAPAGNSDAPKSGSSNSGAKKDAAPSTDHPATDAKPGDSKKPAQPE